MKVQQTNAQLAPIILRIPPKNKVGQIPLRELPPWRNAKVDQDRSLSMKDHILRLHILILFTRGGKNVGDAAPKSTNGFQINTQTYRNDMSGFVWLKYLQDSYFATGPIFDFTLGPAVP